MSNSWTQQSQSSSDGATWAQTHVLAPYLTVLGLGLVQAIWLTWHGIPSITSDHAVYHSPAVELVTHGRMAIPCFSGLFPQTDEIFAAYPPLFQFVVAGWYALFEFSLRSSLAYSFVIHIINALAFMRLTQKTVEVRQYSRFTQGAILLSVGVIHLANVAHFDRQEETALVWLLLELIFVQGPGWARALLSGLLVGLAALTTPWVGFVGGLIVTFRTLFQTVRTAQTGRDWRRAGGMVAVAGLVAVIPMAVWAVWMESFHPGVLNDQFFGTMRYLAVHRHYIPSVKTNLAEFFNSLLINRPQLPIFLFTMVFLPWSGWRKLSPTVQSLYATAWVASIVLIVVRPDASTYLAPVQMLLLPGLFPALSRYLTGEGSSNRLGLVFLLLLTAFACEEAARISALPWQWLEEEKCDAVCRRLQEAIPPGEMVDILGNHWYCFQGRNPWYEAYFMKDEPNVLRARWLVLPAKKGKPPFIDAFELVEEIPTTCGPDHTYAYSLWRRRPK